MLKNADLSPGEYGFSFQGEQGDVTVSTIAVDMPEGIGPKLHTHPYEEVFVVLEGTATFTAGDDRIEVSGGQIVVVPAGVPHKFVNSGRERLRQVTIHASDHFITQWLEE